MTGRITDRERYAVAVAGGKLRQRDDRPAIADIIAAAGMASRHELFGLALWRARYANDRHAYLHAQSLLLAKVANVSRRKRWREGPKHLKLLACSVMRWSVFSTCPQCSGRGMVPLDGLPNVLSDEPCNQCHGEGHTPIERAVPAELVGRAKDIAAILAQADQDAATAVRRALR